MGPGLLTLGEDILSFIKVAEKAHNPGEKKKEQRSYSQGRPQFTTTVCQLTILISSSEGRNLSIPANLKLRKERHLQGDGPVYLG